VTNIVTTARASFLALRLVVRVAEDAVHDGRATRRRACGQRVVLARQHDVLSRHVIVTA
jgi:hypothetical protein